MDRFRNPRFGAHLPLFFVLAGIAVWALAGCGDSTSAAATTLSHAQLIRRGDAVCAGAGRRITLGVAKETKRLGSKGLTQAAEERILATVTGPGIDRMAGELSGLPAPKVDAAAMSGIVSAFEAAARKLQQHPKAGTRTDLLEPPARMAEHFGFQSCSQF
jgi:hypothetical protein